MKRKMIYAGVPWTAGMFFASFFQPDTQIPAMLVTLLVSAFFFWKTVRKFVYYAVAALFFIAGAVTFTLNDRIVCEKVRDLAGQEIRYEGRVTDITDRADGKSQYLLDGTSGDGTRAKLLCTVNTLDCTYFDTLSFSCTPSEFENSFLFKAKDHYASEGIFLKTDKIKSVKITPGNRFSFRRTVYRYRDHISEKISTVLPGEYGALITAMLMGDRSGLDENTEKKLYRCGTGHMFAVSGMHLALLVSLVSAVLEKTRLTIKKRFFVTEAFIIVFTVFSGMQVSVVRAALMMTLICSAGLFGRKPDPLNSRSIAAIILLIHSPHLIRSSSFLLSVAGTFGASVLVPYVTDSMSDEGFFAGLKKKAAGVFCISVCVFPFSVMFFDEASLVSPVSDIIIIPLCTFSLVCGFGVTLTGGADVFAYPLLMAGGLASKLVIKISTFLSDTGLSSVALGRGFVPLLTLFLTVFVAFTAFRYRSGKSTLAAMCISAAVFIAASFINGQMNRNILSVCRTGTSRSSAVMISMGKYNDVIDLTGKQTTSRYISKLADIRGVHHIDSVSFMKDPYQSMASYSRRLVLNDVDHVYVPEDVYTQYGAEICGCDPEHFGSDGLFLDRGKYTVKADPEGGVTVEYGGNTIKIDDSGISTAEGAVTEQNVTVRQSESGKVKVYRLE